MMRVKGLTGPQADSVHRIRGLMAPQVAGRRESRAQPEFMTGNTRS